MKKLTRILIGLGWLSLAGSTAVNADIPALEAVPPGADVVEVVFDREPVENGLVFDRAVVKPVEITVKGRTETAWVAENGSDAAMRWLRPFFLKVTDPRFQQGRHPVVDLEVTFYNPGFGGVQAKADTAGGARQVGTMWGNSKDWKVLRAPIDDAFFGARTDAKETGPKLNGFDLRIDGANGPFYLKRVRLIGYDASDKVAWSRMLKVEDLKAVAPSGVFAFERGKDRHIEARLVNVARVEGPVRYRLQIADFEGKSRHTGEGRAVIVSGGHADVSFAFDTSDWPLGPYEGRVEVYSDKNPTQPACVRTFRLGVVSDVALAKARPGEFLYGLDASNHTQFATHTPTAFAYYRLMGVDMLRNPYDKGMKEDNIDNLARALSSLATQDLKSALMVDPPKETDAAKRATALKAKLAFLEEVGRRFAGAVPGKVRYLELGNEPDLPFFYPGEISSYIESYQAMYDAVKRGTRAAGLPDSTTVVMNGGLSFAGATGERRSEEFIEKVDAKKLDAIGYHGHGPGIQSERAAYERLQRVVEKHGKTGLPFVETESGFSGVDRTGLAMQARTVVGKMTYAQSKGASHFIFFRLFMEGEGVEGGYTMAENFTEPRPSVFSYRAMVERLRHHRYVRTLDFAGEAGAKSTTAFLFEEIDAAGAPSGRKTLVAFAEEPVRHELRLALNANEAAVKDVAAYDLYGNLLPVDHAQGVAAFTAGIDPIYLTWVSPDAAGEVRVLPSLLRIDTGGALLPGADNRLVATLRNPRADRAVEVEATFAVRSRLHATVTPAAGKWTIPAGGSVQAPLVVTLDQADRPLGLPAWWTVFTDIDPEALASAQLTALPLTLPAKDGGGQVAGRPAMVRDTKLDFGRVAGGFGNLRSGVAYAYIDSPRAVEMECGASGDWYMAWYLNGEKVQDTLEEGNGHHGPVSAHPFTLKLRAGRNLIAVVLKSGSGGWAVLMGGPKELHLARTAGDDPDAVLTTLKSTDGRVLAQEKTPFKIDSAVPALGDAPAWPASWSSLEPLAAPGSDAMTNFWMKEPDSSRWYKGEKDLSAVLWLRQAGDRVRLRVAVRDDRLVQAPAPGELARYDGMRLVIVDDAGTVLLDETGGLIRGDAAVSPQVDGVSLKVARANDETTLYEWTVPKSLLGRASFRVSMRIYDNDADYPKQIVNLGDVETPSRGLRALVK